MRNLPWDFINGGKVVSPADEKRSGHSHLGQRQFSCQHGDPLTLAPLCDHERDWHLIGLSLTCRVALVSSVARKTR